MLSNVRIVLINTFHPGNIGAAARAMKNMGLNQLFLVNPVEFPHPEASSRAAGALELLEQATVVDTLSEAIADCPLVIGTSARSRSFPWPMLNARECGLQVVREAQQAPVAIVFGRERMGLHNDELRQCNYHVAIDADPEYPVLNVSAALQVICYEIWMAHQALAPHAGADSQQLPSYPDQAAMQHFYQHLEATLKAIGFILPQHEGKTMTKLQRFFNRGRPEQIELNMLRGILSAITRHAGDQDN
ncbi:tRNA (cytosine(32)/uridine(32)-2'-O)-methyltransferase TrmJ [Motiliproteus sediminis]|uniref:tRNA (cytosine(32)/uridine(32)-2'-O)-methyltransferase TrmJ n=1 Tax=Motiliproteus sediminis TaxID=1468178 RepID=UPI001AEFB866|nr:tRNA (cytosine(32)/uridine(32)-2'-O)-methyltransferase TrmJ [Motiliproteus sediminis]